MRDAMARTRQAMDCDGADTRTQHTNAGNQLSSVCPYCLPWGSCLSLTTGRTETNFSLPFSHDKPNDAGGATSANQSPMPIPAIQATLKQCALGPSTTQTQSQQAEQVIVRPTATMWLLAKRQTPQGRSRAPLGSQPTKRSSTHLPSLCVGGHHGVSVKCGRALECRGAAVKLRRTLDAPLLWLRGTWGQRQPGRCKRS